MARSFSLLAVCIMLILPALVLAEEKKVIIGFHRNAGHTEHHKRERVHRAGGRIKRVHALLDTVAASLPKEAIAALKNDPEIAYVEEDRMFSFAAPTSTTYVPPADYADSWSVVRIGADQSARNGNKGAGVKVAILDSGIDYNHPDLKDNYQGGYNFAYDNNDPFDDTRIGHGTHVAGIIAAKDNGTGVVGVAPDASIYAVKVLNGGMMGSTSDILAGIEWAITNNMDIINMSFGIPFGPLYYSQAVDDACAAAYSAGIIIVAAAGNSSQPNVDYPAAFDSVIAVSATARDDSYASYSNYGSKVEVAAPGSDIKSTVPGGSYALLSGTSQAAPHATGVAALMLSASIQEGNTAVNIVDDIRQRLGSTAHDLGDPGRDDYFGFGLVKAPLAEAPTDPPVVTPRKPRRAHPRGMTLKPLDLIRKSIDCGWEKLLLRSATNHKW